jgi:hypothetical protein
MVLEFWIFLKKTEVDDSLIFEIKKKPQSSII